MTGSHLINQIIEDFLLKAKIFAQYFSLVSSYGRYLILRQTMRMLTARISPIFDSHSSSQLPVYQKLNESHQDDVSPWMVYDSIAFVVARLLLQQ